jgi:hypothetical protein
MNKASPLFFFALLACTACGGSTVDLGAFDGGPGSGSGGNGNGTGNTGTPIEGGASSGMDSGAPSGPVYEVHVRASQSPVTFSDGYAGETPIDQRMGVRKLTLLRNASDPNPLVVFDNGANAVDAGLNDGNDTVCGSAVASTLPNDTFTIAHVTVGYYKFKVGATMHANGTSVAGDYSDLEVLTDNTSVDGQTFNQGHYSYTFEVGSTQYGTLTGENLVTPVDNSGGGLTLVTMGEEVDYVFAVNLQPNPSITQTVKVILNVNTYQNFRWQDQNMTGYATGVFDTTPSTYEPVMSFGANSFSISVE